MSHKLRMVFASLLSLAMFAAGVLVVASPAAADVEIPVAAEVPLVQIENVDLGGVLIAAEGNAPVSLTSGDDAGDINTIWAVVNFESGGFALRNLGTGRYLKTRSNASAPPPYEVLTARANAGLHASYRWSANRIGDTQDVTLRNDRAKRFLDADSPAAGPRVDLHPRTVRGTAWRFVPADLSGFLPTYSGPQVFPFDTNLAEIDFGALVTNPLGGDMTFSFVELASVPNSTAQIDPDTGVFTADLSQGEIALIRAWISATNSAGTTQFFDGEIYWAVSIG